VSPTRRRKPLPANARDVVAWLQAAQVKLQMRCPSRKHELDDLLRRPRELEDFCFFRLVCRDVVLDSQQAQTGSVLPHSRRKRTVQIGIAVVHDHERANFLRRVLKQHVPSKWLRAVPLINVNDDRLVERGSALTLLEESLHQSRLADSGEPYQTHDATGVLQFDANGLDAFVDGQCLRTA
jgi:hypothetical protein